MEKAKSVLIDSLISTLNLDELRLVGSMIQNRKEELAQRNKYTLKQGDIVIVNHPKLKSLPCTIREIKRTKALVQSPIGSYNVPLSMLELSNTNN